MAIFFAAASIKVTVLYLFPGAGYLLDYGSNISRIDNHFFFPVIFDSFAQRGADGSITQPQFAFRVMTSRELDDMNPLERQPRTVADREAIRACCDTATSGK